MIDMTSPFSSPPLHPETRRHTGRGWHAILSLVLLALVLTPWTSVHAHGHHAAASPGMDAAFDADGRLWVVSVQDGHVVLRHSDDAGHTLSAPRTINKTPQNVLASIGAHPHVAIGNKGQLYVSWSRSLPEQQGIEVLFAYSDDGGRHFSDPQTINQDRTPTVHYFDALAVDAEGRVIVAWIDGRERHAADSAHPYRGFAIYYTWSEDGGRHFRPGRKLVDHSCECCRLALADTPDGHVTALFRMVYPDHVRDHALARLRTDGSHDAAQRVTFSDWQIAACPEQGPQLAIAADGTRHAVWFEASSGPAIHYGQLIPGQPPEHAMQVAGAGASHADIVVNGQRVWIAWNQVDADGYALMLRTSHDGGAHFGTARVLARSSHPVAAPELLLHDGRIHVAWNSTRRFRLVTPTDKDASSS